MKAIVIFLITVAAGFAVGAVTAAASGRREAWDAPSFWTAALPAMVLVAGIAGYVEPRRFFRWGIGVAGGLWLQMLFASSGLGNLWPIGLVFTGLLAGVCGLGAWAGAALRRRLSASRVD